MPIWTVSVHDAKWLINSSKNFRDFMKANFNKYDTLSKISPLFYSEFGFVKDCLTAKRELSRSSTTYNIWLSKVDYQPIDNVNKL